MLDKSLPYDVKLVRSARKSISLEISPRGEMILRAPQRASLPTLRLFLQEHADWIERQLAEARQKRREQEALAREAGLPDIFSQDQLEDLRRRSRREFPPRVAYWAERMGLSYQKISIRAQRTRWGSCSSLGNLNFNCLLLLCPHKVQDYVFIHELAHLVHMNHGRDFWTLVEHYCPDYRSQRDWLREKGGALMARLP